MDIKVFMSGPDLQKVLAFLSSPGTDADPELLQSVYDVAENAYFSSDRCVCDECGSHLSRYGTVRRSLKIGEVTIMVRIQRYLCPRCGRVHRFLIVEIFVPGRQICAFDADIIARSAVQDTVLESSELSAAVELSSAYRFRSFICTFFHAFFPAFTGTYRSLVEAFLRCNQRFKTNKYELFTNLLCEEKFPPS